MMRRALLGGLTSIMMFTTPALSEGLFDSRETLGFGRLFTNDFFGDGEDRWRTGSYAVSWMRGPEWGGQLPAGFGELIEYRFRTEIIAPDKLNRTVPDDRRYAGVASVGIHTHFARGAAEFSLGADAVFIGEQTGLGEFQKNFHERVDAPDVEILDDQLGNDVYLTGLAEMGQTIRVQENLTVRPFVEAQAGVETLVRVGGDLRWGLVGQNDLWARDVTTGQRYRATEVDDAFGIALTLGGDLAYVADSAYLPDDGSVELKDSRHRLRAGMSIQGLGPSVFYGLTYLGEEFEEQDEGQLTGSLHVNFKF